MSAPRPRVSASPVPNWTPAVPVRPIDPAEVARFLRLQRPLDAPRRLLWRRGELAYLLLGGRLIRQLWGS